MPGRSRSKLGRITRPVSVLMTPEQHRELSQAAFHDGQSVSEFVRMAIADSMHSRTLRNEYAPSPNGEAQLLAVEKQTYGGGRSALKQAGEVSENTRKLGRL